VVHCGDIAGLGRHDLRALADLRVIRLTPAPKKCRLIWAARRKLDFFPSFLLFGSAVMPLAANQTATAYQLGRAAVANAG
jgi:hypothetical protein